MKRKAKVALHLRGFKDANGVLALARRVIQGLTDNAGIFAAPDPAIAVLIAAADKLEVLIAESANRDKQKIQDRNDASAFLLNLLGIEASYVDKIADGDRNLILLSGFDSSDEPNPLPPPPKAIVRRTEPGPGNCRDHCQRRPFGGINCRIGQRRQAKDTGPQR